MVSTKRDDKKRMGIKIGFGMDKESRWQRIGKSWDCAVIDTLECITMRFVYLKVFLSVRPARLFL